MRARTIFLLGAAGAVTSGAAAWALALRPWARSWGVDPDEAAAPLPGDDLVVDATVSETRGVEIGAPPEAVWPWLVQMGYGRAGWYSYDAIDMKGGSAERIVPELQDLAVGDSVPNAPDTAFVVSVLEPGRALVLYADEPVLREQLAAANARKEAGEAIEETPANFRVAGRMMPSMPGFAASWAFVLTPVDGGRTRLVERFRVRMPENAGPAAAAMSRAFGFGVFAMTRRQMLGIRDRTEAALIAAGISAEFARPAAPVAPAAATPAPAVPVAAEEEARAHAETAQAVEATVAEELAPANAVEPPADTAAAQTATPPAEVTPTPKRPSRAKKTPKPD